MRKSVHIGAILRYAPAGLRLYSPCYGWIKLVSVDNYEAHMKRTPMIICKSYAGNEKKFFMDGTLSTHGECMLYPSDEHRSWDRWQGELLKPGAIVVKDFDDDNGAANTIIYAGVSNSSDFVKANMGFGFNVKGEKEESIDINCYRYASYEEQAEFNRDLLYNGFKWTSGGLTTATQEEIDSAKETQRLLSEILSKKAFDVSTLKPFDKVLYIPWDTSSHDCWRAGIISMVCGDTAYIVGMDRGTKKCIPYDGNEHLVGEMVQPEHFYC